MYKDTVLIKVLVLFSNLYSSVFYNNIRSLKHNGKFIMGIYVLFFTLPYLTLNTHP